jgi:hypothetical protein
MSYPEGAHDSPADTKDRLVRVGSKYRAAPAAVADGDNVYLLVDSLGRLLISGGVAHDDPDTTNPFKIGVVADTGNPDAVADGDMSNVHGDEYGKIGVFVGRRNNASAHALVQGPSDATVPAGALHVVNFPHGLAPDGSYDIGRLAGDAEGSGKGVVLASPTGHKHNNVSGDGQVMGAAGKLHSITVNQVTTAGVLTLYDSLTESGTVIAPIDLPLTGGTDGQPYTLHIDVNCATGLYLGFDASLVANVTASVAI